MKEELNLEHWAMVHTMRTNGERLENLYIMPIQDARDLCEDDCAHGTDDGGMWVLGHVQMTHYDRREAVEETGEVLPFYMAKDDGRFNDDFERLGIEPMPEKECGDLLAALGWWMVIGGEENERAEADE